MAELRSLLAFMDPEDRARALRRYEQLFDQAGEAGEEELLSQLGSPIRQVLEVEKEYRRARSEGKIIYSEELPNQIPEAAEMIPVQEEEAPFDLGKTVRDAAAALEELDRTAAEEEGPEEDLFPIADLERPDILPLEETPVVPQAPESVNFSEEPEQTDSPEQPPVIPESDSGEETIARELDRIMRTVQEPAYEEPEYEKPGAARVFGAVLATVPLILLWVLGLVVFLVLGACSLAAGFAFCAAGVYFAGYALGGYIAFMPDLLLVCGGALGSFAMALLFLWLGLWFIVGGFVALVRITGRTYRRILRKKAWEDEDDE